MPDPRITDGSVDFSGGIDSGRTTTILSQANPNGLRRDQLAWMVNATVRGGGIIQRNGSQPLCVIKQVPDLYQGGLIYEPDSGFSHLILSIAGQIYRINVATDNSVENLSALSGLSNPVDVAEGHFCQGEQFVVIQAGDMVTLPLFYDGVSLRRSLGLAGKEIPAALSMDYYMGRLWYVGQPNTRTYCAGDIVRGPSGTLFYNFRDSILKVTESPVAVGGDGFIVPDSAGGIRALRHTANLDTALGEGELYAFTRKKVFALKVPVTRADWISTKEPLQRVIQMTNGSYGDRAIVSVNGDLYYQSVDGIRSLLIAVRNFPAPGNTPISRNVNRALNFNDRQLMRFASGCDFNNRLLQTALPFASTAGTCFKGILPLDFDVISSIDSTLPPAWEGIYEGLDILQLFSGDFGGLQRCFAVVQSRDTSAIELWELTNYEKRENGDRRVTWAFETPAYTWANEFALKQLDSLELWLDRIYGTVRYKVEYRPDADPCWHPWHEWKICTARNSAEDVTNPISYPLTSYHETYRSTATLPKPPLNECATGMQRPAHIGYQFQFRVIIKGWCRVRGLLAHAYRVSREPYMDMVCGEAFMPDTIETD